MFSGSYDTSVRVWNVSTLTCKATLQGHGGAVRALVSSPSRVFSGSDDFTIKVWDTETLRCVKTLEGHEDNVRVLAVGEKYMFSGSWDKTIRVWDLESLECVQVRQNQVFSMKVKVISIKSALLNSRAPLAAGISKLLAFHSVLYRRSSCDIPTELHTVHVHMLCPSFLSLLSGFKYTLTCKMEFDIGARRAHGSCTSISSWRTASDLRII